MDRIEENIMEITLVWARIADKLDDDADSMDIKQSITEWATQFEKMYKDTEFGAELDYYETIETFAEQKLLKAYGKCGTSKLSFFNSPLGDLYMMTGDNGVRTYVEIGIKPNGSETLVPFTCIEVDKENAFRLDANFNNGYFLGMNKNVETYSETRLKNLAQIMKGEE